jgi:ribosome-associated protein
VDEEGWLVIDASLAIPRAELVYRASRSGGPGGQHVNTSATQVELTWDVARSPSLSEEQRVAILGKLGNRIDGEGVLHLSASASRSQYQNRQAATERLRELVAGALRRRKPRRKTKPPRAAREARLRAKKRRSEVKRERGAVREDP